jgi:hypothetical protein
MKYIIYQASTSKLYRKIQKGTMVKLTVELQDSIKTMCKWYLDKYGENK